MRTLKIVAWIAMAATLILGCRGNTSRVPPIHPNQNMDFQQYFESQERNDWFPNHQAMRQPVPGTVARTFDATRTERTRYGQTVPSRLLRADQAFFTGLTPAGARQAKADPKLVTNEMAIDGLPRALKLTKPLVDRGKERFGIFCTPCHALDGSGQGTVPLRAGPSYNVPSYHGPTPAYAKKDIRQYRLGFIYHIITHGRGVMGSHAAQVPPGDRWAIAVWVRTLQLSQSATLADVPAKAQKGWKP